MKTIRRLLTLVLTLSAGMASAQMAVALRDANQSTSADWVTAQPILRAAVECRKALEPVDAVRAVFRMTNANLNGDHQLPGVLTIFGSVTVEAISVFDGGDDEGASYTIQPKGMTMAALVKAARLKKDGPRYIRQVKGGLLEASEPQPGIVQLACIRGSGDE